jgi:NADH-quinone oxidoreductase subunit H
MSEHDHMTKFTTEDALRPRWSPQARPRAIMGFTICAVLFVLAAVALGVIAAQTSGLAYVLAIVGILLAGGLGATCLVAALAIRFTRLVGRILLTLAFPMFIGAVVGMIVVAWLPALFYEQVDAVAPGHTAPLTINDIARHYETVVLAGAPGAPRLATLAAYGLWPLQFHLTRDILAALGVLGFVSIVGAFGIWWERKSAGRMQSRMGPMRVGGWHGWAQSMADGLKLIQKEDIFIGGADRLLFRLAVYISWPPAVVLFLALPFSAAWVGRDLDIGILFIFAMLGTGVIGVLLAGWASNNKWSMYGAMREACQMISYEIPLGFALLIPVMTVGTLRLTTIGELQSGGFHTWLAFQNPFLFAAALLFFVATLAECKRAPFDLPEAESELVAGYLTEYSGFRWALFFFAEYAEMYAVAGLAAILFFGAWYSPLPAAWGAAWVHGPLWQRALHGLLYCGPLWFIAKGFALFFVQIWLRWTLPRIRLDQVMHACIQGLLPLAMIVLLGNTAWVLFVEPGSVLALAARGLLTALGALTLVVVAGIIVHGYANRRRLVGTMYVDALPGA